VGDQPRLFSVKRVSIILVVGAAIGLIAHYGIAYFKGYVVPNEDDEPLSHLKLGGTSSAWFMVDAWRSQYHNAKKNVAIDYESTGSTAGIGDTIDKKFMIGFAHSPMSAEQKERALKTGGEMVQIPVVICAVVPIYNLKELKGKEPIRFTPEALADIYLGNITMWDDDALQKINKQKLPHTPITVVHRQDSSGTTFIFTDYLDRASASFDAARAKAWQEKIGKPKSEIKWPVGVGKERSTGMASFVAETEGAIGYVELLHVYMHRLDYGAVQNTDKSDFLHAEPDNMEAAAKKAVSQLSDDLNFNPTNQPGAESYPICGAVWAICYKNQPSSNQRLVVDFLIWITHKGQYDTAARSYAPLPRKLVARIEEKLKTIAVAQ
jgi:phosphate ABC transporter phosphate-binding protein